MIYTLFALLIHPHCLSPHPGISQFSVIPTTPPRMQLSLRILSFLLLAHFPHHSLAPTTHAHGHVSNSNRHVLGCSLTQPFAPKIRLMFSLFPFSMLRSLLRVTYTLSLAVRTVTHQPSLVISQTRPCRVILLPWHNCFVIHILYSPTHTHATTYSDGLGSAFPNNLRKNLRCLLPHRHTSTFTSPI
jgi:hypothetical protein